MTTTTYFNSTNFEAIKKEYKDLCKKNHPDVGGNDETMKEINAEFQAILSGKIKVTQKAEIKNFDPETLEALQKIIDLDVDIELCGSWIWVSGNTKPVKDTIKAAGFFWASKKKMWYFKPVGTKSTGRGKSMEYIRATYGSKNVVVPERKKIA